MLQFNVLSISVSYDLIPIRFRENLTIFNSTSENLARVEAVGIAKKKKTKKRKVQQRIE